MTDLHAQVSFPSRDDERAAMALRGWLRLDATDLGYMPDWSTMTVEEPTEELDDQGRTWWRYGSTIATLVTVRDSG